MNRSGYNEYALDMSVNASAGADVTSTLNWEAFVLMPLVIFGVAGNILVAMAVTMEKRLQSVTNYFLLSLSITDLLVCMVVWPFSIIQEFFGYWPLTVAVCDLFITSDVLLCTSSILHLCTISLERFLAIRSPLVSRTRSKTAVRIKILLVYFTALAISSPIMILGFVDEKNILHENQCILSNKHFIIYGSVSAFYIPLGIMGIFFGLTIHLLRAKWKLCDPSHQRKDGELIMRRFKSPRALNFSKRLRALSKDQQQTPQNPIFRRRLQRQSATESEPVVAPVKPLFCKDSEHSDSNSSRSGSPVSHDGSASQAVTPTDRHQQFEDLRQLSIPENELYDTSSSVVRSVSADTAMTQGSAFSHHKHSDMNDNDTLEKNTVTKTFSEPSRLQDISKRHQGFLSPSSSEMSKKDSMRQKQVKNSVRTEKKASKTLGIIFGCFVVCWGPFMIVNIMTAICETCSFDHLTVTIFVWLGYVSSTLNPIIYTVFNRTFRTTIIKLMKCQYRNVQKSMRIKAICVGLHYNTVAGNADVRIPL